MSEVWRSNEVLAWTEREGPRRPPDGPSRLVSGALTSALGAVLIVVLATDSLCPEHRAWVQAVAGVSLTGVVAAIFGLVRGWPAASWITLISALGGVWIGVLDAAHDTTRGRLIAGGFALCAALAALMALHQVRLGRWDRSLRDDVAPLAPASGQPAAPPVVPDRQREASSPTP